MTAKSEQVRANLDNLIDWYQKNKPDAGQSIQVNETESLIAKFCNKNGNDYFYRGRRIVPLSHKDG